MHVTTGGWHTVNQLRSTVSFIAVIGLAGLVVGCSSSTETAATTTTATSTTPAVPVTPTSTAPIATTSTTEESPSGCATGSATIPSGAVNRQTIDVDGDGKPDTAWIASAPTGAVAVGVVTAAGGGAERSWDSASPVTRSLMVVSINETTPPILLADDGRTVQLWAFDNCTIADVDNVQGQPYTFSLGFTDFGTGVGCTVIDGTNELVGLNATIASDSNSVQWTSTVVDVTGTKATNGAVVDGIYTSPADDSQIKLLHEVTCGAATIGTDGLTFSQ